MGRWKERGVDDVAVDNHYLDAGDADENADDDGVEDYKWRWWWGDKSLKIKIKISAFINFNVNFFFESKLQENWDQTTTKIENPHHREKYPGLKNLNS